jgi:catalase
MSLIMVELSQAYVRYDFSVAAVEPNEEKTFDDIAALMHRLNVLMNDRYRHAIRAVHAKSHGLLKAELEVDGTLPEALRQGLFAQGGSYPAIIRLSTNPGDILADSVSAPRGMAVKVVGVRGEMVPNHVDAVTQDFVFVNDKAFGATDAAGFLKQLEFLEKNANDSESFKKLVSATARGVNAVLGVVGQESGTLKQLGHPETHIVGETYASVAALRYGDYIAKICFTPASENLKALKGKSLDVNGHYSALKNAVVDFFKTETAEWDVGVQLCTDLKTMPVEDASVQWPEDRSPYHPVGRLIARPQDAYSPQRRVYVDEMLSFNPWHALAAHRPLGNIMRARRKSYEISSRYRHETNGRALVEPRTIEELPD